METQKTQKLENCKSYQMEFDKDSFIVLNGIVIHKDIIDQIDFIQTSNSNVIDPINRIKQIDNSGYESIASKFAEIFTYISTSVEYNDENEKAMESMISLGYQLNSIENLSVPQNIQKIIRTHFKHNAHSFKVE